MASSSPAASSAGSAMAAKRSRSQASEALLTSSRRKMSLLLYSEWIMRCSNCLTSVWKPRVWGCSRGVSAVVMGRRPGMSGSGRGRRAWRAAAG